MHPLDSSEAPECRKNSIGPNVKDVESVPGRLSGAGVSRVPTQAVVDNARAGCTPAEIATEIFELPLERERGVLRFDKVRAYLGTRFEAGSGRMTLDPRNARISESRSGPLRHNF